MYLTDMSGKEPTKKMPVTDFEIDEEEDLIPKCPGNHIPVRAVISSGQSVAYFSHPACDNCIHRENCYAKRQKKNYVVRISLKSIAVGRERAKIKEFKKENTSKRAGIEGTNSALKRKGLRKLMIRGLTKCKVVSVLMVTTQNIICFTKYKQGKYKSKAKKIPPDRIGIPIFT